MRFLQYFLLYLQRARLLTVEHNTLLFEKTSETMNLLHNFSYN